MIRQRSVIPNSAFLGSMAIIGDGDESGVFRILDDEWRYDLIGQGVQSGRNGLEHRRYFPFFNERDVAETQITPLQ